MSVYRGQEKVLNSITAVEEAKVKEAVKEEVENSRAVFTIREVVTLPFTASKSGLLVVVGNPPNAADSALLITSGGYVFGGSSNVGQQYTIVVPMLANDTASVHHSSNVNVTSCVFYY